MRVLQKLIEWTDRADHDDLLMAGMIGGSILTCIVAMTMAFFE